MSLVYSSFGVQFWGIDPIVLNCIYPTDCKESGSSVNIISDYGPDDRGSISTEDFFSILWVQTDSVSRPASCLMGTGNRFPESKMRPGRDANHSPRSGAEVNKYQDCTFCLPRRLQGF
jgi:hypothetical protein